MSKHTYQIAFRGDIIRTITSVYEFQHVVLGYKSANGSISVLNNYKTFPVAASAACQRINTDEINQSAVFSAFVVKVFPGLTEISEADVLVSYERGLGEVAV